MHSTLIIQMIGVYVSAGWCPPCRAFSPVLSNWAKERKDEFEVVFVSLDKRFVCLPSCPPLLTRHSLVLWSTRTAVCTITSLQELFRPTADVTFIRLNRPGGAVGDVMDFA